jgi:hypothetical protein
MILKIILLKIFYYYPKVRVFLNIYNLQKKKKNLLFELWQEQNKHQEKA